MIKLKNAVIDLDSSVSNHIEIADTKDEVELIVKEDANPVASTQTRNGAQTEANDDGHKKCSRCFATFRTGSSHNCF